MSASSSVPPEIPELLLGAELRGAVWPQLFAMIEDLAGIYHLKPSLPLAFWLLLLYAAGNLFILSWQVVRQEAGSRDYLEGLFGGAHHPATFAKRIREAYPHVVVHLPKHASWLNQIELYFSIYHRKVLTPNDCPDRATPAERTGAFQARYNRRARPFHWQFTVHELREMMKRVE